MNDRARLGRLNAARRRGYVAAVLALQLLPMTASAQGVERRRWEITASVGKATGHGTRGEFEQALGSLGLGDDVPCPPRFVGTICGGADVYRYPHSGTGIRNTWAVMAAYRMQPTFSLALHYMRAELARAAGHESATDYEIHTRGALAALAIVPTWVARDAYRIGIGPALLGVTRDARAQQWSRAGAQASDASTARTAGLMIHASASTRSDVRAGLEVAFQHILAGSVTLPELTLTPSSPQATLVLAPQKIRASAAALRIGFVVRP
jgi:hypothetical protein